MALKFVCSPVVTVTTAGTRVQVSATQTPISSIMFQAASTNTNGVWIGDITVLGSTNLGIRLLAGQVLTISGDNRKGFADELYLSDFYCDSDANGNKVQVTFVKQRN